MTRKEKLLRLMALLDDYTRTYLTLEDELGVEIKEKANADEARALALDLFLPDEEDEPNDAK